MGNFIYGCRKYFFISPSELFQILVTSAVGGFVLTFGGDFFLSFGSWGTSASGIASGTSTLIEGIILVFIAMLAHASAQKLIGIRLDYVVKYSMYKLGLLVGVLITFLTNGLLPLFFTGEMEGKALEIRRVGKYQPRYKFWEFGIVSFSGPMMNLLLILVTSGFYLGTEAPVLMHFIKANIAVMIYSMIPIPLFHGVKVIESGRTAYDFKGGTIGFNLFLASRGLYVFFMSLILVYSLLILIAGIFSFFLSVFLALVMVAIFIIAVEKE